MGIPGILKEIGKGERVALAKLAIEHFEKSQRPFRIAIDAAIWNFQNQAGQGGKQPALRTLFYRLLKILALPIQPVFVYDGRNKPLTKRGKTVTRYGSCVSNENAKKLIQTFHFPHHTAPGEAEAECAMLQRKGLVDAVMSQDVDAIMFGSTLTLRDWSKEASKHNKTPTHVNALNAPQVKEISGLDPDGMILVALLSGGDYDEAGVPGFGPGLACEVARAGFGKDLLDLVRDRDEAGIGEWRERLQYELQSNESGFFKTKHKSVRVPVTFPDRKILDYYMHPAISIEGDLPKLEQKWHSIWNSAIEVQVLRDYVAETFDWLYKPGAWKFVRVMAPALLADGLRCGSGRHLSQVDQITERRKTFISDGVPELRLTMIPANVVGIDLDLEADSPEYLERLLAEEQDPDNQTEDATEDGREPLSPSKTRKVSPWSPHNPEKLWIAEAIVQLGAREQVETWHKIQHEIESDAKKFATRNCRKTKKSQISTRTGGMQEGAMHEYMVSSKKMTMKDSMLEKAQPLTSHDSSVGPKEYQKLSSSTKFASQRSENAGDPRLQSYFQVTKKNSQTSRLPEKSDFVENLSQEFEEMLIGEHSGAAGADKHSRPSTSASSSLGCTSKRVARKSKRIDQKEVISRHAPLMRYAPTRCLAKSVPATLLQKERTKDDRENLNVAVVATSGIVDDDAPIRRGSPQAEPDVPKSPPRRARRTKPPVQAPSPQKTTRTGTNGSPRRVRRPIESFFAPYIAAAEQKASIAQGDASQLHLPTMPGESSTGLKTTFSSSHVHAVPRSSLPGTWKEVECESSQSSTMISQNTRSGTRLSIVDLTSS